MKGTLNTPSFYVICAVVGLMLGFLLPPLQIQQVPQPVVIVPCGAR